MATHLELLIESVNYPHPNPKNKTKDIPQEKTRKRRTKKVG